MKVIVITLPTFFDGEAEQIAQLLHYGYATPNGDIIRIDLVHIRKPKASREELEELLKEIPANLHGRLVLHDHHSLAKEYDVHGLHLNSRNPIKAVGWHGSTSRSCHSFAELQTNMDDYDYLSISPIFDSISKQGYKSAFSASDIAVARSKGLVNEKVYALGGVTFNRLKEIEAMGFGGAMILGDAWKKMGKDLPVVLSIAGSDPSAGAGIQQDLKTMTALGCYGATVITAVTSQNTIGVQGVMPVPAEVVRSQMRSVLDDMNVKAIKIGMIPNMDVAKVITEELRTWKAKDINRDCGIVVDPVMVSTSGTRLMSEDCIEYVQSNLFPLCTLVTPNMPEAEILPPPYPTNFLIKGGHAQGDDMTDTLHCIDGTTYTYATKRITTKNLHGTGCTLSSAIACGLAQKKSLPDAVQLGKDYITSAIEAGKHLFVGKGNGPLGFCPDYLLDP